MPLRRCRRGRSPNRSRRSGGSRGCSRSGLGGSRGEHLLAWWAYGGCRRRRDPLLLVRRPVLAKEHPTHSHRLSVLLVVQHLQRLGQLWVVMSSCLSMRCIPPSPALVLSRRRTAPGMAQMRRKISVNTRQNMRQCACLPAHPAPHSSRHARPSGLSRFCPPLSHAPGSRGSRCRLAAPCGGGMRPAPGLCQGGCVG